MANEEPSKEPAPVEGSARKPEVELVKEGFVDGEMVELAAIEEFAKRGEKLPRQDYLVRIENKTYQIHKPRPDRGRLLEAAGKRRPAIALPNFPRGKQPDQLRRNQRVDLRAHGIERFTTVPKRSHARAAQQPPCAATSAFLEPTATASTVGTWDGPLLRTRPAHCCW